MADLKNLKGLKDADRKLIEEAESWLGPDPSEMGAVKNMFWGNFREDLYLPYPSQDAKEIAECDQLLARLEDYLRNEHPAVAIDQDQEIPQWVIKKLFYLGVMGMTIPKEFGGLGMGITSYNRVLEMLGAYCGSTAVLVSAHQSIGCKAVMLFGNETQKKEWLPHLGKDWVSAFCLSEPNVGCDAGGQETRCELSADGSHYILNGEKKWATSGALSGLFTVMAKQKMADGKERVSALVCHPWMEGIEIYSRNRSKCGIRGTWQARIRFHNVKVPRDHLLGQEGKGLNIALSCLNYGRCTLSAGMLGGARRSMDQAIKWSRTRFQFSRPLGDFELVKKRLANMTAMCYAMDAMLYMTTGMLDRKDTDIQIETATCKVFCSEMGWRVVNDAVQIMGGESYMTENEVERVFRDSRINLIVEGANEVMQSYVLFSYGGKQLAEYLLNIRDAVTPNSEKGVSLLGAIGNLLKPKMLKAALPIAFEVFLGKRRTPPSITKVSPELRQYADRLARLISEHTYQFKVISKKHDIKILDRQAVQARLADVAMWLHAWACTLGRLDLDIKKHGGNGAADLEFQRDKTAAIHFFDIAERSIEQCFRELYVNADDTMLVAADAAIAWGNAEANGSYIIPERSPNAKGTGRTVRQDGIKQFGSGSVVQKAVEVGSN
jgi:acyl-CoA dehydrogenase family member 9